MANEAADVWATWSSRDGDRSEPAGEKADEAVRRLAAIGR